MKNTKKKELIFLRGLPASGKSTWAKALCCAKGFKRFNMDDLRSMIDGGHFTKDNEKTIQSAYKILLRSAMEEGHNVIADNTHFNDKWEKFYKELCEEFEYTFTLKEFNTDVNECVRRDSLRDESEQVGERVIRDMYNRNLRKAPVYKEYDLNLDECIICDIDGTLAHMSGRSPFDWKRVKEDEADWQVRMIVNMFKQKMNKKIFLFSGRDSVCRPETEKWLKDNNIQYDELHMRPEKDNRSDVLVKQEMYDNIIKDKYNVLFVLDDRKQVVDMWRKNGLKCLQVEDGDF